MTDKEVLERAIQLAKERGWDYDNDIHEIYDEYGDVNKYIIYNKEFAKSLWGEKLEKTIYEDKHIRIKTSSYKYHLQQMVISDNPIQYLKENI